MSSTVLKGGISNYRYVWHANMCACQRCQESDNTIYDYEGDIPDLPHPNCKCYIEVIEDSSIDGNNDDSKQEKKKKDDEKCDCLDDLFTEIEEMLTDAMMLQNEILSGINLFTNILITKQCSSTMRAILESCIDALEQIFGTVGDFIKNYNDMKEANTIGGDKYFHAKANCQGAQRGELGAAVARGICVLREFFDQFTNTFKKGLTIYESLVDSYEDFEAKQYGREQGRNHPNEDSRVLVDKYRPNGLPDKY